MTLLQRDVTKKISSSSNAKQHIFLFSLFALLCCLAAAIILLASVPPVSRDALTHHLFVPRLYLEHGGIYEIPTIPFSYYPMNLDLLYMIPLYFGNDILPKYIHFLFALLTAWLIYDYLKIRISRTYGLLGSLFFLSIPIIVKLSITVYVDLGLMFFTTASLLLLFRWIKSIKKIRYLIFAGLCCGLAAGTKYNGLVSLFLLSLFTPVLYIRSRKEMRGSSRAIWFALIFVMASLTTYSPWLIRNFVWTGNPIYPLHDSLFNNSGQQHTDLDSSQKDENSSSLIKKITTPGSSIFASRKILYHETWWQALLLPVRFFFEGQDDDPHYFDGKLNPFLFILPFFAFLRKSSGQAQLEKYTLFGFAVLFFFFTFFQEAMRIRYIVTILPSLVLLSMVGLHNISTAVSKSRFFPKGRTSELLLMVIVAAMLGYNGEYILQQFQIVQPISYVSGKISRDQYIAMFRPEYPVIQYANNHVESNAKVLCLFLGNRGYYMHFQPVFKHPAKNIFFDGSPSEKTDYTIKKELIRRGINHILLRNDLTDNWFQHLEQRKKKRLLVFFQKNTRQVYSRGGFTLYNIR